MEYPDTLVIVLRQDGKNEDEVDPEEDTRADFVWFTCRYLEVMDGYFELLGHNRGEHGNLSMVQLPHGADTYTAFTFEPGFKLKHPDLAESYLYMTIHSIDWEAQCYDEFRIECPCWADERIKEKPE
jgi:hypothetical protein